MYTFCKQKPSENEADEKLDFTPDIEPKRNRILETFF